MAKIQVQTNVASMNKGDFLDLLSPKPHVPPDFVIKVDETDIVIYAHKFVLARVSSVFVKEFYGSVHPLRERTEEDSVEVIDEKCYSFDASNVFIRFVYGDQNCVETCV